MRKAKKQKKAFVKKNSNAAQIYFVKIMPRGFGNEYDLEYFEGMTKAQVIEELRSRKQSLDTLSAQVNYKWEFVTVKRLKSGLFEDYVGHSYLRSEFDNRTRLHRMTADDFTYHIDSANG